MTVRFSVAREWGSLSSSQVRVFSVISPEILTMRRFGLSDRYAFVLDRMLHSDSSFRRHTGPPINGALLSTEYIWWRSIVFSGVSVTFLLTSDMSGVL